MNKQNKNWLINTADSCQRGGGAAMGIKIN